MGDSLAVEIAQQGHYNLLRTQACSLLSPEVMQYRKTTGPFYELLTIDDHIGLQKVPRSMSSELVDTDSVTLKFLRQRSVPIKRLS